MTHSLKIRIDRCKMATSDPSEYGYSAYVDKAELTPAHQKDVTHVSILDSSFKREWVSFPEATRSEAQRTMPTGIVRYNLWMAHEKAANAVLLKLARSVYPELSSAPEWPTLWTSVDLSADEPRHVTRFVEVSK